MNLLDDNCAIINALSDAIAVIGLDYRIQQANTAARALAAGRGISPDADITGCSCHQAFACDCPPGAPDRECPVPTMLARGEPVRVTHVQDDGLDDARRYIDIIASPLRDAAGRVVAVIESRRDVTDERRLEETLIRRHEQLSILNTIARTVNQSLDLADILGRALDEVLRLTGVDVGAIFLREETLGSLDLLAHRGLTEEAARAVAQFGMLDGSCGGVAEQKQVIVVPALSRYRGRRARTLQREQLNTLVHVPLIAKGATLGSMCVATRCPREFDASEQDLLAAIGSQIAVAIENARLYAEVQRKEHLRGELLRKVITAQEEERKRIARELHDDTSQALTALLYAAEEAMELSDPAEVKLTLKNMRGLAQRTLDGVHKLIFDLRPSMLDHLGLAPALRWFAQSRLEPSNVRLVIEADNLPRRLPAEIETTLFRVVQEAVTNIVRHALARNVRIAFRLEQGVAAITVEDDGLGFDVVEVSLSPDSDRGLGLLGMRERVQLLGGEMTIDSAPGQGTRLDIFVPVDRTFHE
ncbi:MAG: GAF domain-containing protein [Chloroflexi bacterium]|nr:GAF domain-containing protein [Chloroflexota bacterium]